MGRRAALPRAPSGSGGRSQGQRAAPALGHSSPSAPSSGLRTRRDALCDSWDHQAPTPCPTATSTSPCLHKGTSVVLDVTRGWARLPCSAEALLGRGRMRPQLPARPGTRLQLGHQPATGDAAVPSCLP